MKLFLLFQLIGDGEAIWISYNVSDRSAVFAGLQSSVHAIDFRSSVSTPSNFNIIMFIHFFTVKYFVLSYVICITTFDNISNVSTILNDTCIAILNCGKNEEFYLSFK